ncbi:MAG: DUF58 domain-containing protein [Clostridia bacterium]|nr:DUF58 domain-containing protein [Clostridia bacterium]
MSVLWLVVMTIAFAVLQAVVFGCCNFRKLTYTRLFDRISAFEGEKAELLESIENKKMLPVPWLRAESRIPKQLHFEKEQLDAHEVSGGLYHKSIFYLSPMLKITRHHEVRLTKRGLYDAGSVVITCGDLFSMSKREMQMNLDCAITVYPRILDENELPDPAHKWLGDLIVKRWIMPDPFLVNGIRDYRNGDSMKDVHWRASARTGDLRVKVRDFTSDPRAMVVLNIQTSDNQWADVGENEAENMEQAIRIAATMCVRALSNGMQAGFSSNACLNGMAGKGECVFVPSRAGNEQMNLILDTMARMMLHRELSFQTYMDGLMHLTGEDILILSFYETDEIREKMNELRIRGNTVDLLLLKGGYRA